MYVIRSGTTNNTQSTNDGNNKFNDRWFFCGQYGHKKSVCWYNKNNTQNNNNSGNNNENANNASEHEELEDVSLICLEIPKDMIIYSIQDTTHGIDDVKQEMIVTCNYYDVLICEENDKDETDSETEDNSVYTGDDHYDYYNVERYNTEFYNGDDDKDETAMAVQQVSFKDIYKQTWLGDAGTSAHMTNSLLSMKNLRKNNTEVTVGKR